MKIWIAATSLHSHTPLETKCNWYDHHTLTFLHKVQKLSASTGLVNMSAICFLVDMYLIVISPELLKDVLMWLQKWWYLMAICFVRGVNFNDSAIVIANKLSLWSIIQKSVIGFCKSKMQLISLITPTPCAKKPKFIYKVPINSGTAVAWAGSAFYQKQTSHVVAIR